MRIDNRVTSIDEQLLPSPLEAVELYRAAGGIITDEHQFGIDPLLNDLDKHAIRQTVFIQHFKFNNIFHQIVNGDDSSFREALLLFIDITYRLSRS